MPFYGDNGGPRVGFHLSWIIGVVIILFGIVRYMSHTQVNPVTGEKQHLSMTADQEKSLGLQAAPRMAARDGRRRRPRHRSRRPRGGEGRAATWRPAPTPPAALMPATSTTTC